MTDDARLEESGYGASRELKDGEQWPYSFREYVGRVLWRMTWHTVWKLCWKRITFLRSLILRLFGARTSLRAVICKGAWIEMPWALSIGDYSTIGPRANVYNLGGVSLGARTTLSQDVYLCGGTHDYTDPTYPLLRKKIEIGDDVWVGAGAFVYPGVKIGDGAVIAARAVVVKDVEPWTVVGGNPARFIKKRVMNAGQAE
jgi:putative colanic acid biosynthesis acetyltransferase WcaF